MDPQAFPSITINIHQHPHPTSVTTSIHQSLRHPWRSTAPLRQLREAVEVPRCTGEIRARCGGLGRCETLRVQRVEVKVVKQRVEVRSERVVERVGEVLELKSFYFNFINSLFYHVRG